MKNVLGFFLLGLISLPVIASDFDFETAMEEARELFDQRGPGEALQFSKDAADAYLAVSTKVEDVVEKSQALTGAAESLYYVGSQQEDSEGKQVWHKKGWEVAIEAKTLLEEELGKPKDEDYSEDLALAYYWYGANRGKWGQARGIIQSLQHWPDLKRHMNAIIEMGHGDAVFYGAYRILGFAYYKLPFPLGSKSTSLKYLKKAFVETIDDDVDNISRYSINVTYYAQILIAQNDKDEAKRILKALIAKESDLEEYNADRLPETREDIVEAKKILATIE